MFNWTFPGWAPCCKLDKDLSSKNENKTAITQIYKQMQKKKLHEKNTPWQNKNSWTSAKSVPPRTLLIVTCSRRTNTQQFHRKKKGLEDLSAWKLVVHLRITTLRTPQNPVQNIHSTLSPVITLLVQKSVQRRLEKSAGFTVRACKYVHCIHIKGQFSEFQFVQHNQENAHKPHMLHTMRACKEWS